ARVRFVLVAGGQRVAAVHPGLFVLVPAARLAAVPPAGLATVPAGLAPVPAGRAAVAVAPAGVVLVPAVGASSPVLGGLASAVRPGGGLGAASLDRVVLVIRGRFLTVGARVPRVRVTGVGFWPGLARMPAALIGPALLLRGAPCVPRAPGVTVRAALQRRDHPGQVGDGQPECPGAGATLPDAEHGYPRVRVPAQPHAA